MTTNIGMMIRRDVAPEHVAAHAQHLASHVDELWIVEDLPWAGGISQMTLVLEATSGTDVVVGHGIAPAPFRNPMALAMEWATLARLYPGRVACGIGHGVQSWMRDIGEGVDSPLTLLEETLVATQAILAGGDPAIDGRYVQIKGWPLIFPPKVLPVVSAGVVGPRSLELSGRVAGGTVLSEGHGPNEIAAARALINKGRQAAGRADHHRLTVFAGYWCGPLADMPPLPPEVPDAWSAVGETPTEVASKLQSVIDADVDSIVLVPFGDVDQHLDDQLTVALNNLIPALRS